MPLMQPVNIPPSQPSALVRWADQHAGPWRVTLSDGRLIELQQVRQGRPILLGTDNLNAAKTISAQPLWPGVTSPDGLDGTGVTIGLFEGTVPYAQHVELAGRCQITNTSYGAHTTHVAGTLIASGINPAAQGMAPAANISCFSWYDDVLLAKLMPATINITNHSYSLRVGWDFNSRGDGKWLWSGDTQIQTVEDSDFGRYDTSSVQWDELLYHDQHILVCRSAGNDRRQGPSTQPVEHWVWSTATNQYVTSSEVRDLDGGVLGYGSIHDAACAKNTLTVGGVADITPPVTAASSLAPSSYSSCGPTDDGRIKPDLCGNGDALTSSSIDSANNPIYAVMSGTSMSSPSVAGGMALLMQRYRQLYPGVSLHAPTLKALAIQTAIGSANGPNYRTGWGLLHVKNAVDVLENDLKGQSIVAQTTLSNRQVKQWSVYHPGGDFRATLCWSDPPAAEQTLHNDASSRLVVDLDLRIVGSTGTLYPWTLDPAQPELAAIKADNSRDNVERVDAPNLPVGYYTVSVSSKSVLGIYSPFGFSLVVSGIGQPAARVQLQLLPDWYIGNKADVPASVQIYGPYSYSAVHNMDMLNPLELLGLPQGGYQLTFSSPHFLQRVIRLELGETETILNVAMINGDVDGNGSIDLFDFVGLDLDYEGTVADLNGDGIVNLFDYVVVDASFGAQSDK